MKLSQFKYPFSKNLIAKNPKIPRDACKLMVVDPHNQTIESKKFKNVIDYMNEGDVLVLNDSKVFPSRLFGTKEKTKAKIEVFLLRLLSEEENIYSKLWKNYFNNISIPERENKKLQMKFVPKKYWNFLNEMEEYNG